jgi:hypothetical protein
MAYGDTFHPAGAARDVKVRGPVWVGVWSLVTFGIYAIFWIYATAKDLSEYGKAKGRDLGQKPGMTLLALLLGWIIIVPPIVVVYRQAKRIQQAQRLAGHTNAMNGWLALVLYLVVFPIFYAYQQSELNKAWAAEGGPVPDSGDGMPPELERAPDPTTSHTGSDPTTMQAPIVPSDRPAERPPGA